MIRAGRRGSPSDGLIARQLKGLGPFYKRPNTRCERGKNLAQPADFAEQRALSRRMLDWYNIYPILYRRMDSGRTTAACQLFCGGGGSSEGVRRSGGVSIGVDLYDQPDYRARFGDDTFVQHDALLPERGLVPNIGVCMCRSLNHKG